MENECTCGDVFDEHEDGGPCTVDGCGCVHFEVKGDDEDRAQGQ